VAHTYTHTHTRTVTARPSETVQWVDQLEQSKLKPGLRCNKLRYLLQKVVGKGEGNKKLLKSPYLDLPTTPSSAIPAPWSPPSSRPSQSACPLFSPAYNQGLISS